MALTNEELAKLVEALQSEVSTLKKEVKQLEALQIEVSTLNQEVKQYRQDILALEQQLSESVTTQKLVVTGEAQIFGRNIMADGQMLDNHEQKLNANEEKLSAHGTTLNAHEVRLKSYVDIFNTHEVKLNSHADIFNTHEVRLNELSNRTQKITCNGDSTMIDAGNKFFAIQGDGNLVVYLKGGGALWSSRTAG